MIPDFVLTCVRVWYALRSGLLKIRSTGRATRFIRIIITRYAECRPATSFPDYNSKRFGSGFRERVIYAPACYRVGSYVHVCEYTECKKVERRRACVLYRTSFFFFNAVFVIFLPFRNIFEHIFVAIRRTFLPSFVITNKVLQVSLRPGKRVLRFVAVLHSRIENYLIHIS